MCATVPEDMELQVRDVGINELHFPFAAPSGIIFRGTSISILHAAGADLRNVAFEDGVHISTLEIDRKSQLPAIMPHPHTLVHPGGTTSSTEEIAAILAPAGSGGDETELGWSEDVAELLGRIERYRSFWLRTNIDDTDPQGRRIISHSKWAKIYQSLQHLELVTVKNKDASGTKSDFVHFRQNAELLNNKALFQKIME